MINHHTVLREQLKKIGNNINKKYGTLRKQILKTSEVFDNEQIPVFPYQVCFGLFRQIIQTGSVSSSMAFLPFIQNIINLGFSNADMSRQILTLLAHTKSIPKFSSLQNQVKLQQILAILVSKNCIELNNLSFTYSLFNIVLSLQNTKYRQIWLKSSTILYQTVQLLINDQRQNPTPQKQAFFIKFTHDLVKIIMGQKVAWLIQYADSFLIFYVLSQVLDDKYFSQYLHTATDNKFKAILLQLLNSVRINIRKCTDSFIATHSQNNLTNKTQTNNTNSMHQKGWELSYENKLIILMRVGCKISILIKGGFQLLQQIIKIISQKKPTVYKAIAYEATNYLFRNSAWMFNLFQSEYADLFNFLLTTQFNTIKYLLSQQKDKVDLIAYVIGQQTNFCKIMGSTNIDVNVLDFNYSHQIKMIVKNLQEVAYALYAIYSQKFKIDMNEKLQGKPPLQKTYKFCQKTVFQTIKTILSREMSQDTLQSLLKISQKFINMSGCFGDSSVSAIYVKLMCKFCMPAQFKNIDHRHIQINKMILNTANCLGHLFTSSCWVIVWKTLQNYSIYYNRYLLGKQQLQSARESDVQILYKSMDSIFTQSPKYNDKYLLQVIRSLVEVAYECLQNNYNDQTRKIFAFQRIQQIYKLNLSRICIIWPQLSSSLLCITTSKVLYFRLSALALLNTLIPLSLNYLNSHKQKQVLKLPFTLQNYEELLLQPWINLVSCQFQQIKDQFLIAVNKLIIDYGHIMTNGWRCIMQIVKKTNDLKSLQAIVQTFLQKVHNNVMDVIISVDNIQRKLHDTNQKYLCLTMIWAIADYSSKNEQYDVLKKIYHILLVPEEMFNLGTEARHSSFYIFAQIIVHNCSEKQPEFWVWIFQQIQKFYTYGIKQCLSAKNKNFGEEALKNLITNLIKIYKKFFLVSKQWGETTSQICSRLLAKFYQFCSAVIQFRCPQIYQNLLKQCKEILYPKTKQSLCLKQYYGFLQSLTQIYFIQNDSKILKCLITYLPPDIYDILTASLEGLNDHFVVLYRLMQKVFLLRLQAYQKQIKLQQMRIFFQQKYHYEYMKKMINYICDQKPQLIKIYIESISKTLHKLKLYEDFTSLIKSLPLLVQVHLKHPAVHSQLILQTIKQIIKIRSDQSWLKNANTFKDVPVWYICIQDFIKISYQYLQNNMNTQSLHAYQAIIQFLFQNMKVKLERYGREALSYFYESQVQLCHFLMENYFLSNRQPISSSEIEDFHKIVLLIEKRSQEIQLQDHTKKGYNAYQLLFKLCNKRQKQSYIHNKIEKNQSFLIGCLIRRAIKTFQKVKIISLSSPSSSTSLTLKTENTSSNIKPIKAQNLQQLKYVIRHLLSLSLKAGILVKNYKTFQQITKSIHEIPVNINSHVLELEEAHLFYLQPLIIQFIRCQDHDVLQVLQSYLDKTSKLLIYCVSS